MKSYRVHPTLVDFHTGVDGIGPKHPQRVLEDFYRVVDLVPQWLVAVVHKSSVERRCVAHICCAQPRCGHHRSGQTAHDQYRSNHRAGRMAQWCELCLFLCLRLRHYWAWRLGKLVVSFWWPSV